MIQTTVLKNGTTQLNYISQYDGKIVGRLKMFDLEEPACYIVYLHVNKSIRTSGVGSRLLLEAIKQAKEQGCTAVSLFVKVDNEIAISFYKKRGFFISMRKKNVRKEWYWLMSRQI